MKVRLLNIPNYYSSYYLYGLHQIVDLTYQCNEDFSEFNGKPLFIFEVNGKLGVIDNDDPIGIRKRLYDKVDLYFATNKLLNYKDYQQPKVRPLLPHYPINFFGLYLKLFGTDVFSKTGWKNTLREAYIHYKRPIYEIHETNYHFEPYVFFAGSIWKKELWANRLRSDFIEACQKHPEIVFQGGLTPRDDGNMGLDAVLSSEKYSPKKFSELSKKSMIAFNNPAVLGAVSWRLAEYWNMHAFVLSFPFQIELPLNPVHGEHIHFVDDTKEFPKILDFILKNRDYHKKISLGGKSFFDENCQPDQQARYILESFKH